MKNKKILFMDSHPEDLKALRKSLERANLPYEYFYSESLQEARALTKKNEFDLIVTDFHLKDGQATEIFDWKNKIPMIISADAGEEQNIITAIKGGAVDYVVKDRLRLYLRVLPITVQNVLRFQEAQQERNRYQEELEHINLELEQKVSERTLQLAKALEEIKLTQHQLIQQERLRALGEMASGIVHDFNNALSPILGYTELLLTDRAIREDKQTLIQFLQIMNVAARHAGSLVKRLREFFRSREQDEAFVALNLNLMIEDVIAFTQPKWKSQALSKGADIRIRTELDKIPPMIESNETQMREVLTNLIFNAVDAMPQGGEIVIRTAIKNATVVLEVQDHGIGMDEEVRRRCWEPFFTTKGDQGSGLGLSVVYGIIQRHGGSVEIQSQAGRGTTFSISLLQAMNSSVTKTQAPKNSTGKLNILYVEDNPHVRDIIVRFLEREGHKVETADTGTDGFQRFQENPHGFDLVITDRALPQMSGEELVTAIKEINPGIPIILLSGTADEDTSCEVEVVVSKPVTMEHLREAIAKAIQAAA